MPSIVLRKLMIFNPNYGQNEGQEKEKLLYHWTKDAPNNKIELIEQIDDICLCDASITASTRFNPPEPLEAPGHSSSQTSSSTCNTKFNPRYRNLVMNFETTLIFILEVEPEESIWFAIHVALVLPTETSDTSNNPQSVPNQKQYDLSSIPVGSLERVVINIYERFCLINGTFQMISDEVIHKLSGEDTSCDTNHDRIRAEFRAICNDYFNAVLPEVHLNSIISNIASLYNYVVYLDINPLTLMKVNSFINHLVCVDAKQIRHTIALFNDQLLWSSLDMYNTRLVYNYLVSVPIRDALQEELSRETEKVRRIQENLPIYLRDAIDESNVMEGARQSSIKQMKSLTKSYMTVFRSSNNMTLALILRDRNQFDLIQKCYHLLTSDARLGVMPLASLAQTVGQNFLKSNSINSSLSSDHRYLSIDKLNASMNSPTTSDVQNLFLSSHDELQNIKHQTGRYVSEFFGKTINDSWLTVTNSKYKSIYSVSKARNASLSETQQRAINLRLSLNKH